MWGRGVPKKNTVFCVLFLIAGLPCLFAQQESPQLRIEHSPVSSFTHGDIIPISATVPGSAEWVRFYFRHDMESFQARIMERSENGTFSYEFDTSILPVLEFEYYLEAQIDGQSLYYPPSAPQQIIKATGISEEPIPEIPDDLPDPQEEAAKFRLPMIVTGNVQTQVEQKEKIEGQELTDASGNVRVYHNHTRGDLSTNVDSNFNYTNAPLEGQNEFDLSNMMITVKKANHTVNVGDINVNESEYSAYGLGRRGLDYTFNNNKAYFHVFDVSSQQPQGFKGFGIPKPKTQVLGGAMGYSLFQKAVSIKAIYLTGKDDPEKGVNVGFSPWYQSRQGDVIAVVQESRLFNNSFGLKAEFAQSKYDDNLNDEAESLTDNAYKVEGDFSYGNTSRVNARFNYYRIGKDFNSIGQQYTTNNRKGYEANVGFNYKVFNLSTVYSYSQDNVDDDPVQFTTSNQSAGGNMALNIGGKVSVNLGYRRDNQETTKGGVETMLQDSIADQYSGNIGYFIGPSLNLNLMVSNSTLSSENNPYGNSSNLTVNFGGSFRHGQTLSLNPSVGFSKQLNKYTSEETRTYNFFLTGELAFVPQIVALNFSGSFNRMEGMFGGPSDSLSVDGALNLYLDQLLKIGRIVLSLKGSYRENKSPMFTTSDYTIFFTTDFSFD